MSEWNIGPFEFEYNHEGGKLVMWHNGLRVETLDVPPYNLPAAKVAAGTVLLKALNTWKYWLFEYIKDLDVAKMVAEG